MKSQVVNDGGRCIENNTICAHDQRKSRERLQDMKCVMSLKSYVQKEIFSSRMGQRIQINHKETYTFWFDTKPFLNCSEGNSSYL